MKPFLFSFLPVAALAAVLIPFAISAPYEDASKLRIGDDAPSFSVTTAGGETFSTGDLEGKVILVNLFATWCGPCRAEMPHLQKGLYEKYGDRDDFAVIALAREETNAQAAAFAEQLGLTFPVAGDANRSIYNQFADGYIPRNYLIGKDGKIRYASVGYNRADFEQLIALIGRELE